jgi:hypothetical protein
MLRIDEASTKSLWNSCGELGEASERQGGHMKFCKFGRLGGKN